LGIPGLSVISFLPFGKGWDAHVKHLQLPDIRTRNSIVKEKKKRVRRGRASYCRYLTLQICQAQQLSLTLTMFILQGIPSGMHTGTDCQHLFPDNLASSAG